ncbi:hypothetical protein Cgig2_030981 [Carnegiea gigantea]|uniref:RNase H type-1 domain-containing protein n=1 Tax=Carnegiea gigantea TaxID=171969 RepID=A0A9Q1KH06_9CARY|nr:hypothetical protein Cgig2_030981 [Carnegiea gigantea]
MRQVNAAFMTKLRWRVLSEKDCLWSRVLRAKYCNERCDVDMFTPRGVDSSNAWGGIIACADYIRKGIRAEVRNSKRTLFWYHSWALTKPLCMYTVSIVPPHLEDVIVEEMWDPSHGWKWDVFVDILPQDIVKAIVPFELKPGEEVGDQLVWEGSSNGSFTIKSTLSLIKDEIPEIPDSAEMMGLLHGLRLAKSRGYTRLIIQMDSQIVVNMLRKKAEKNQAYFFLLKECQSLLNCTHWSIIIAH